MNRTEDIELYHGSGLMSKATEECGELVQAISCLLYTSDAADE